MKLLLSFVLLISVGCAHKKKDSAPEYKPEVAFEENGEAFKGNVVLPKKFSNRIPAVIVVHEWWGKNDYSQTRAKQLADAGYAAIAVDLFGDNKQADNPKDAMALAGPFYQKPEMGVERLKKYVELVKKDPHVDPSKVYVVGYCFGGTQALNLARSGEDLAGVVSFHGGLTTTMQNSPIKANILVLHGEADPMVPPKDVKAFEKEMKGSKAKYKLVRYKGATHAFTNPASTENGKKFNIPIAYDPAADQASWNELMKFLKN